MDLFQSRVRLVLLLIHTGLQPGELGRKEIS